MPFPEDQIAELKLLCAEVQQCEEAGCTYLLLPGLRLTRRLCDEVRVDLARPHAFAAERVGFLFGRLGNAQTNDPMVLFTGYSSLDDERYINDPNSGARIDSHAIRGAMQQVINRHEGVFHVHMHEWNG